MTQLLVAVVMGSQSDWDTMQHTVDTLKKLGISYHCQVVSAHRTPDLLFEFADSAGQGFRSEIKNASSIVVNGGNIQITFVDGSNVNFTST